MLRCDQIGISGLTATLRENFVTLKEIQTGSVESIGKTVLASLADEIQGTEAEREITNAIEESQKVLNQNDAYEKLRKCFPQNLPNPHAFKRKGYANKQQVRQFLEEILRVFPDGFLGEKNSGELLDSILDKIVPWKSTTALRLTTSHLRVLECGPCRALRSRRRRLLRDVSTIQRELLIRIAEFLTGLLLKTLLECAYFYVEKHNSDYLIYDKKSFEHWRRVEKNKFIRDYSVELAERDRKATSYYVLGKSLCRPILMCTLQGSSRYKTEMRVLAACLDAYIQASGFKSAGAISSEITRLRRFFKCHGLWKQLMEKSLLSESCASSFRSGPLFFAKADVQNCFACVNRDILKKALKMVMENRTLHVVYGYGRIPNHGFRRVDRAAPTYEAAVKAMFQFMKKKKLECISRIPEKSEVIPASHVFNRIMSLLDGIRLSLDRSDIQYEMRQGVPQGFELSSRLAHIYLLYFESTYWEQLSRRTCLLRYVDDYLVCSYSRAEVMRILKTLQSPNEFGVSIRLSKCEATFRFKKIPRARRFIQWCGWQIDTKKEKVFKIRSDAQLLYAQHCYSGSEYARQRILRRRIAWAQEKAK
ncbi:hypothetical protein V3C99_005174 [Haemonchus contortus]